MFFLKSHRGHGVFSQQKNPNQDRACLSNSPRYLDLILSTRLALNSPALPPKHWDQRCVLPLLSWAVTRITDAGIKYPGKNILREKEFTLVHSSRLRSTTTERQLITSHPHSGSRDEHCCSPGFVHLMQCRAPA